MGIIMDKTKLHIVPHSSMMPADAVVVQLSDQVKEKLRRERRSTNAGPRVVRVQIDVPDIDPLHWLSVQRGVHRFFWNARDGSDCRAGFGVADEKASRSPRAFQVIGRQLAPILNHADPAVRYMGGGRFDTAKRTSPEWASFHAARFVLPRFELAKQGGKATLACNLYLPVDQNHLSQILDEIAGLRWPMFSFGSEIPVPVSRLDAPSETVWRAGVQAALRAFKRGRLDKVVLARQVDFLFNASLDPCALLYRLRGAATHAFHFLFGFGEGTTFLGATPERLFKRKGRALHTEAVAGTRPRGSTEQEDAQLQQELLSSEKDLREHAYVRDMIVDVLKDHSLDIASDPVPSLMELSNGRHLYAAIDATLRDAVDDFALLDALHPTPAVGGVPAAEAFDEISRLEPFDRGWYAGPVGWLGRQESEFAVGIRSALVSDHKLALFSGAGIVEGSVPRLEWAEIEQKISNFLQILELELQDAKY